MTSAAPKKAYGPREELAHAITHGLGVLLASVGLVAMILVAADSVRLLAGIAFGVSMIVLYAASTIYHAAPWPRAKERLKTFDHIAIYYLIAGTYTPFTLITIGGRLGWTLFAVEWFLALAGTVFKLLARGRFEKLSLAFYLIMGWLCLPFIGRITEALSAGALTLLIAGGLLYTVGAAFYAWNRLPHNHAIWHLFVLAGSVAHFFCILWAVLPAATP